jgi:hypothetical protein
LYHLPAHKRKPLPLPETNIGKGGETDAIVKEALKEHESSR